MSGIFKQFEEQDRLNRLEKRLKSAKILNKTKCIRCGFCCHRKTCIPTPAELKKIAKFLKMTTKELISKYYAIDRKWTDNTYYLKPVGIKIKDLVGKYIPSERTYDEGKCIFLEKKGKKFSCKIYPVRPKTARITKCWTEKTTKYNPIKSWKKNKLLTIFGIDGEKKENEIEIEDEY